MKKIFLLLSLSFLLVSCYGQPADITTSSNAVQNGNVNATQMAKKTPELKKTAFVDFPDGCPHFRCVTALQKQLPEEDGVSITPPEGYAFLKVDVLPKDYVLMIKEKKVYTYNPSTKKITPFTFDDTKQQVKLEENETLFAKESYNVPGKYLFIQAEFMGDWDENGGGEAKTTDIHDLFVYNRGKDTLTHKNVKDKNALFVHDDETGDVLSNSPFLYDGVRDRVIAWGGLNHEMYVGLIGEATPNTSPLLITTLKDGVQKRYADKEYVIPTKDGKMIMSSLKVSYDTESFVKESISDLNVIDVGDKITTSKITWSAQAKKDLLSLKGLSELGYGYDHADLSSTSLTLSGFWGKKIVFTLKKGVVTGVKA